MNGTDPAQLYWIADISATVIELGCFFYLFKEKKQSFRQNALALFFLAIEAVIVIIATKFNIHYLIKALFLIFFNTFLWSSLLKTRISITFFKAWIYNFLSLTFIDNIATFIIILIWNTDIYIELNGTRFVRIESYIISKVLMIVLTIGAKRVFTYLGSSLSKWKQILPICGVVSVWGILIDTISSIIINESLADRYLVILIVCSILLCFATIYYMIFYSRHLHLQAKEQINRLEIKELEQRHKYYEEKLKEDERIRSIYHDMKNHLLLLQETHRGNLETSKMIAGLQEQISSYKNYYKTGNTFLDIIIRDKAREANEQEIDFNATLYFEDGSFINPLDLSTIFGNALDNAIEASIKLPVNNRLITVKAKRIYDMLSIAVENHISGVDYVLESKKQDKLLHGLGLKNIERAVEKYDGQCSVEQEDGRFTLKIIIPIPLPYISLDSVDISLSR